MLAHAAVAWPDARNASNIREIRARAESTKFNTPDGVVVGEEGIRRLTGLPLSCVQSSLSLSRAYAIADENCDGDVTGRTSRRPSGTG